MNIPILNSHNTRDVIGKLYSDNNKLFAEFIRPVSKKKLEGSINAGYIIIDENNEGIEKIEILEVSLH